MKEAPLFIHIQGIPEYIVYTWVIMGILFATAFAASRGIKPLPAGIQNFFEMVVDGIMKFMEDIIGHHSRQYLPLIGMLAFFILISNLIGLVPGFMSPTSNINTTAACAIIVFFATHYYGVKAHGISYIKHFFGPIRSLPALPLMILMLILEIIGHVARVLSLSLRLFGNIFGEDLILLILVFLVPILMPLPIMFIAIFTSVVQTFVFVLLTMIYIKLATEEAEEGH
ncbi:MAG: F0F1 ATP synthase subunit A [Nitrospirota bacterium]|mgnify:FL=1